MPAPIGNVGTIPLAVTPQAAPEDARPAEVAERFGQALLRALASVDAAQKQADRAAEAFVTGENRDVAQLMLATEQARLTMELALQLRNKVLEAYQEIIRMQI